MGLVVAGMLVAGLAGGMIGSRLEAASPPTTTTTMPTTTTTLLGWGDLTDAEKVWCDTGIRSHFRVAVAADVLGLADFERDVLAYQAKRDQLSMSAETFSAFDEEWTRLNAGRPGPISDGLDPDVSWGDALHSMAVACRAAFEAR